MNEANGGVNDPNHIRNTFNVGAALIDQYDGDDLYDPDPNPPGNGNYGNTITIIDYDGNTFNYAYGIEAMSYDDPNFNFATGRRSRRIRRHGCAGKLRTSQPAF